ncbi:DUF4244 domain-containing protein [Streptomyces hokutonensis]|uniref:DUF4244 domain-containing protein n=1 Tax=Streptomyces hokutonensis TaxID=1306990 RepID=A0ABW6MAP0_9ACTN
MYKAVQGVRAAAVRVVRAVRARAQLGAGRRDAGMATAEYAMGLVAAVAFAVVLYKVVTSGAVSTELQDIVKRALDAKV